MRNLDARARKKLGELMSEGFLLLLWHSRITKKFRSLQTFS